MEKTKEIEKYLAYQNKLRVLRLARDLKSCREAYEIFGVSKSTFYSWKKEFDKYGKEGLTRKKRKPESFADRINLDTVKLILKLRDEHKLGTW